MARKVILETGYTFNPSTKTVVISKNILRERLILITNVTMNQVIYNFSDQSLKATSYTNSSVAGVDSTTLVLNFNTVGMSSTDKLQIVVDEYAEKFTPAEINTDPANKFRTSTAQALIDTDFEYGTQVSKWENLGTINMRPFAYPSAVQVSGISGIVTTAGSRVITVNGTGMPVLPIGTPIVVRDTLNPIANGIFAVDSGVTPSATTFTFIARAAATATTTGVGIFDANKTAIVQGNFYTGAAVGGTPTMSFSGSKITVTTSVPHGLSIGNEILVTGTSATSGAPNGTWVVAQVVSPTVFNFYSSVAPTGTISGGAVYTRSQAAFLHRPFDGGVIFTSNGTSNYEAAVRQTRRYFRYQSGKGIQMSSGTILKPNVQLDLLKYSTSTNLVTVTTKDQHNIQPGSTIVISGANESIFNGTFTNFNITGYNSFTYTPTASNPGVDITATGLYYVSVTGWYGAANRLGIFDHQNGLFFEFDGQTLYAVRRNSTYQIAGRVDVTNGSNTITANANFPTAFPEQLVPGDFIVVRGQSYRVDAIASETSLTISPSYRGITAPAVVVSKTQELRVPQSQWNIDKMDGTGPSGYTIDLSKMQMFYIDFSWYGAGFVRWGLRATNGDIVYVHKIQNNNVNFEAYMRSGNLPGRYESVTQPQKTILGASVGASDTSITVASTTGFPSSGTLVIKGSTAYEHVNYSGITATSFTGLTRAQAGATTTVTIALGSNVGTVSANTGIQVGQRVVSATANSVFPDGTFVSAINGTTITFSQALTGSVANPSTVFVPMGATTGTAFTYSALAPIAVEQAFPTFAPTISHWGTSVIMDGRFDDDKSLLFTYGQPKVSGLVPAGTVNPTGITVQTTTSTNVNTINISTNVGVVVGMNVAGTNVPAGSVVLAISGTGTATIITISNFITVAVTSTTALTFTSASSLALMSVRIAPSVDNGIAAAFGTRDLINRMQLVLRSLDVSLLGTGNILVTLNLNGLPSTGTSWSNIVGNSTTLGTSSLAQIADYAGGTTSVTGGETTGGFFVSSTGSVDLPLVRDLGNSILGGGGTVSGGTLANAQIYPDGPDVVTVVVQNVGSTGVALAGRLSWTEAQA
jgi:hypothetical protein